MPPQLPSRPPSNSKEQTISLRALSDEEILAVEFVARQRTREALAKKSEPATAEQLHDEYAKQKEKITGVSVAGVPVVVHPSKEEEVGKALRAYQIEQDREKFRDGDMVEPQPRLAPIEIPNMADKPRGRKQST